MKPIKTGDDIRLLSHCARLPLFATLLSLFMAGCCKTQTSTITAPRSDTTTAECGRLDRTLLPLATHADPMAYAEQNGLLTQSSHVRVIVAVDEGHVPQWPTTMTVELQLDSRFQLLVLPTEMCALGQRQGVSSVSVPNPASPKDPDPPE